jgi:glycosyltransferase involved in cell wall biosynthesis
MEELVVRRADVVVSASDNLRERLAGMGRESHLLTHGVDLDFWQHPRVSVPSGLLGLERPLVVFWGVVDRRMDATIVKHLAGSLSRGTIVFAGPEQDADPELRRLPRTAHLGVLPFAQLPSLAREASVLLMPYADLPVTRAMQPLKLKEYLATGRPVVARDLPANRAWSNALDLASGPTEFADSVIHRLETGLPPNQLAARQRLSQESWQAKAENFAELAFAESPARKPAPSMP